MNDNNKEEHTKHSDFDDLLCDLQRIESFQELIRANDCAGFLSLSQPQQRDILEIAGDLALNARCALATALTDA